MNLIIWLGKDSHISKVKVAQPLQNDKKSSKICFPRILPNINIQSKNNIL